MPNPTVSIIIPAYNSVDLIELTLASVFAQDFGDFEVIVVNDGSTDETSAVVQGIADTRVRLIEHTKVGSPTAPRNVGVAAARGEYIALLDHDDFWHPQKLSAQLACFKQQPSVGVVYGEFRTWDGIVDPSFSDPVLDANDIVQELSGWLYHKLLLTNWVMISTAMFRREVLDKVGAFDKSLPRSEDWDYILRTSRQYQFCKLRQVVTLYRSSPQQTSKRPYPFNPADHLRDRTIAKFGYLGPDGSSVDILELRRRVARDRLNFGLVHYQAGNWRSAALAFAGCLRGNPANAKAAMYLLISGSKWFTRGRGKDASVN